MVPWPALKWLADTSSSTCWEFSWLYLVSENTNMKLVVVVFNQIQISIDHVMLEGGGIQEDTSPVWQREHLIPVTSSAPSRTLGVKWSRSSCSSKDVLQAPRIHIEVIFHCEAPTSSCLLRMKFLSAIPTGFEKSLYYYQNDTDKHIWPWFYFVLSFSLYPINMW